MGSKRVDISKPQSEDDWLMLRFEAEQLFRPSAPIDEDELFAGRLQLDFGHFGEESLTIQRLSETSSLRLSL